MGQLRKIIIIIIKNTIDACVCFNHYNIIIINQLIVTKRVGVTSFSNYVLELTKKVWELGLTLLYMYGKGEMWTPVYPLYTQKFIFFSLILFFPINNPI